MNSGDHGGKFSMAGGVRAGAVRLRSGAVGRTAVSLCIALCLALFAGRTALAQQPEVQFLRAWQPANNNPVAEVSGLGLAADGTVLLVERDRGALWRLAGEALTSAELSGRDRPFSSKKTGGLALLGPGRIAVANTSNDTIAVIDEQGRAERVFGGGGHGDGELKNPEGLAFSAQKRLYVADRSNDRVAVYSQDGVFLQAIGAGRNPATALSSPIQVAVDDAERVYVLEDTGSGRLSIYSHEGKMLKRLGADAFHGSRNAKWRALAVDRGGRVFLADAANGNIVELDWERAQVRRRFGSPGRGRGQFMEVASLAVAGRDLAIADIGNGKIEFFRLPEAKRALPETEQLASVRRAGALKLACSRAYALDGGDVLCLARGNGKVARLDAAGKVKIAFAGPFDRPQRAAIDARDIAIVDGDSIRIYAHDGKPRFTIGRGGSRDGEFDDIGGVGLADYIYVADTGNRRVQVFTRDGIFVGKLADADGKPRRLARPTAVVTDASGNIYVADAETRAVQVFSRSQEWQQTLTGAQPWTAIHGLGLDADNRLYVLAATEQAKQVVEVFHGPDLEFSFAAYRSPKDEPSRAATLSIAPGGYELALHDADTGDLAVYQYLQPPQRIGGIEVRGDPARVRVAWRKSSEGNVAGYRVYGALERDQAYERVLDTSAPEAALGVDATKRFRYFRVSAYTNFKVESEPSAPVEDLFRGGYLEFQAGHYEAAVAALARAAKAAPDHAASVEYLGRSLLAMGRHDEARGYFQDLARRPGQETVGRRLEARAIAAGGDMLGARSAVERAMAAGQADAGTYMLCGELSLQLADASGAVRCLETALSREPGNAAIRALLGEAFVRLGAVDKGLAEIDAAAAAAPTDLSILRRAARVFEGLGRPRDALARYARILAIAPRDPDALIAAANAHLALGEYDQARTIALSLVGSQEQESRGQYVVGRIALAQNQNEDAVVAFARATRLDARHGAAWVGLADTYVALKDERKAREALAKAAALPGAGAQVFRRLAELDSRGGQYAAALAALERAVALAPGDYDLRLAQAQTFAALEKWQECGNAAREAQRLSPKSVEATLLAAEAAYRQGKNGEAIETLKRALALKPDSYDVEYRLGRSFAEANRYDDAQAHLERAAQLDDRNDAPQLLLAKVQLERRAFDAAIAALTQAVSLNPSDANKRELDAAYAQKKKAQSGTGARVMIEDLRLTRMFAAAHKQYATEGLGQARVRNDSAEDYRNLRVSFFIKEYMDYPVMQEIPELKAGSSIEVPLRATFNRKVLGIDEDTRVLAVATLATADARDPAQEITQALTLYGKNAILWAQPDMVGSFVTPRDDTLRNFVREAVNRYGPPPKGALNRPLAQAASVYNTLAALGLRYQADPNTPYSRVSADQVDYVQFPRETLRLKSGDCDDLSVLLAAAYENLGIEAALVDVPGHLFLMFRTGVKEADRGLISLQDDLLVVRDGEIWIPVEATLIATSFSEAWTEGARRYREADAAKQLKVISLRRAWERYPPVSLAPANFTVDVPTGERASRLIEREQRMLVARRLEREVVAYRQMLAANPKDAEARLQIGTIYARNGVADIAMREFDAIIEQNPRNAAAQNNRGNLYYERGDFERALDAYRYAEEIDPADAGIRVNAALTYYRLGKLTEAQAKFREATQLRKDLSTQYRALAKLLQ